MNPTRKSHDKNEYNKRVKEMTKATNRQFDFYNTNSQC